MTLQAYIDESSTPPDGTFVLGGHIASVEAWQTFSAEWEKLLPFGTKNKDGQYHFKMKEMAQLEERMSRVPVFYELIEKYVLCSIACTFKISDLAKAQKRVITPEVSDWGPLNNPYFIAFRGLLDMFHIHKELSENIIPIGEKVDFIFDQRSESIPILRTWADYIKNRPQDSRKYFGVTPRFEDDKKYFPLQAADLWTWWVRKWIDDGTPEKMKDCDFGTWKAKRKKHPKIHIHFNEDALLKGLVSFLPGGKSK